MSNYAKILIRRGDNAAWKSSNPILREGELAADTTLKRLKVGDGSSTWNNLKYYYEDLYDSVTAVVKMMAGITGSGTLLEPVQSASELTTKYPSAQNGDICFVVGEKKFYYKTASGWTATVAANTGLTRTDVETIVKEMIKNNSDVKQDVEKIIEGAYKWGMSYSVTEFNGYSKPTKLRFEDGVTATLEYAGGTQLTKMTFSDGTTKTMSYNSNGTIDGVTVTRT